MKTRQYRIAKRRKIPESATVTVKEQVLAKLESLPENASLSDIREELDILAGIEEGRRAAREGRVKPQEEVEKLFEAWLSE